MVKNPMNWKAGMLIEHNGIPMRVERVVQDEWLGEPIVILCCSENRTVIVSERTRRIDEPRD